MLVNAKSDTDCWMRPLCEIKSRRRIKNLKWNHIEIWVRQLSGAYLFPSNQFGLEGHSAISAPSSAPPSWTTRRTAGEIRLQLCSRVVRAHGRACERLIKRAWVTRKLCIQASFLCVLVLVCFFPPLPLCWSPQASSSICFSVVYIYTQRTRPFCCVCACRLMCPHVFWCVNKLWKTTYSSLKQITQLVEMAQRCTFCLFCIVLF